MKTYALMIVLLTLIAPLRAADFATVRAELRATLDKPRNFERPRGSIFDQKGKGNDAGERRAEVLYRSAWVLPNPNNERFPQTSLAHILALTAKVPESMGSDALVLIARADEIRVPLGFALRGAVDKLPAGPQRAPFERAAQVIAEMEKSKSVTNQEWGRAFGDLLRALR